MKTALAIALLLFAGCGDNDTSRSSVASAPLTQCNPIPDHGSIKMSVCRGYVDIGECSYDMPDGRTIHVGDCWSPAGTCLWSCAENEPK